MNRSLVIENVSVTKENGQKHLHESIQYSSIIQNTYRKALFK